MLSTALHTMQSSETGHRTGRPSERSVGTMHTREPAQRHARAGSPFPPVACRPVYFRLSRRKFTVAGQAARVAAMLAPLAPACWRRKP